MDWKKKLRTKTGNAITLVLRPDQTRDGAYAYGYIEPGNELHKWTAEGSYCGPGQFDSTYNAEVCVTFVTLHLNVYKNRNGAWEVAAHESIEEANKHAGAGCLMQTAVTVKVPEEP